jgi:hypothetical protein
MKKMIFSSRGRTSIAEKSRFSKGWAICWCTAGISKVRGDLKEEIAVRKIKKTDCDEIWKDIVTKHTREDPIKHENVLKIIGYEEKDEWR